MANVPWITLRPWHPMIIFELYYTLRHTHLKKYWWQKSCHTILSLWKDCTMCGELQKLDLPLCTARAPNTHWRKVIQIRKIRARHCFIGNLVKSRTFSKTYQLFLSHCNKECTIKSLVNDIKSPIVFQALCLWKPKNKHSLFLSPFVKCVNFTVCLLLLLE